MAATKKAKTATAGANVKAQRPARKPKKSKGAKPVKNAARRKSRRKQRTREHVIASMSLNYVESLILPELHSFKKIDGSEDYGFDAFVSTHDENGFVESGTYWLQFKATDKFRANRGNTVSLKLETGDLELWDDHPEVVLVILYDAQARKAYWLDIQAYLKAKKIVPHKLASATRTVRIDLNNVVDSKAIRTWRDLKAIRNALVKQVR